MAKRVYNVEIFIAHQNILNKNGQEKYTRKKGGGYQACAIFDGKQDRIIVHLATVSEHPHAADPEKQDRAGKPDQLMSFVHRNGSGILDVQRKHQY